MMKALGKALLFTCWLLSQAIGFALPARPSVAEPQLATCPAFEQRQAAADEIVYDGRPLSCLGYDAKFSSATTEDLNDRAVIEPSIFDYDSCLVSTIRIVDGPRAPPVENSGLLAAKGVEQGRDALGRFLPKAGGEVVPGSLAEQAVWDAVKQKPGWSVIEGRVSVRNAVGDLRIYDGAAVSPRGRVIGLEVKSGGASRTGAQSAFDAGVNTFNPAVGVGGNAGLEVGRSLLIRRP